MISVGFIFAMWFGGSACAGVCQVVTLGGSQNQMIPHDKIYFSEIFGLHFVRYE
jgi:hypothetical protein